LVVTPQTKTWNQCLNIYLTYLKTKTMKPLLYILLIGLSSCGVVYPTHTSTKSLTVKAISPSENGLCIYYLKGNGVKGKVSVVDSNNKYSIGDNFTLNKQ